MNETTTEAKSIEIVHRWTGEQLYQGAHASVSDALRAAVGKNLGIIGDVIACCAQAHINGSTIATALSRADLTGKVALGADTQAIRADLHRLLDAHPMEALGLLDALRTGRVHGEIATGECACLIGTIANLRGVRVETITTDFKSPAQQWALLVSKGDRLETSTVALALASWIEEWLTKRGVAFEPMPLEAGAFLAGGAT